MTTHTDHTSLTNDELLTLAYTKDGATPLEIELSQRLEQALDEIDALLTSTASVEM